MNAKSIARRHHELIRALQCVPNFPAHIRLVGIRILSKSVRLSWRDDSGKLRFTNAQTTQRTPNLSTMGAI